jgi:hypothetical protein
MVRKPRADAIDSYYAKPRAADFAAHVRAWNREEVRPLESAPRFVQMV